MYPPFFLRKSRASRITFWLDDLMVSNNERERGIGRWREIGERVKKGCGGRGKSSNEAGKSGVLNAWDDGASLDSNGERRSLPDVECSGRRTSLAMS